MTEENTRTEEIEFNGDKLLAKIKELLHERNTLIDIPLAVGVLGTLVVEREEVSAK